MVNKKMNIYIDSNIWLDLYHFSNNDLKEFSKLKTQEVNIYLPQQTKIEVFRNRISRINDAKEKFGNTKFNPNMAIPNLYKEFEDETKKFKELLSDLKTHFNNWNEQVNQAIINNSLQADKVIEDLFNVAINFDTSEYYKAATKRMNIGNPPGKNNSYGDAINWVSLLNKVPNEEDLYIITNDADYYDDLKNQIVNSFLLDEWQKEKKSKIYIFKSLNDFFNEHLEIISLREEEKKNKIIEELEQSGSFRTTHRVIEELEQYIDSFSREEILRIVKAGLENDQIGYILEDTDVKVFYSNLLDLHPLDPLNEKVLSNIQEEL